MNGVNDGTIARHYTVIRRFDNCRIVRLSNSSSEGGYCSLLPGFLPVLDAFPDKKQDNDYADDRVGLPETEQII